MNGIKEINIKIIDTMENDRVLIVEKTQIENPEFIVNGNDDKFVSLMTTELHFNLLVSEATESIFFHLFTGFETRYKVLFEDVTDAGNPVVVWTGFLLSEQFTEPYIYSDYFVSFVATDGIGRLKDVQLNPKYYSTKKSVLEVINQCLLQTGLRLPILFAPAIENSGFDLNYKDLDINTICYDNDGKKLPAFEILEKVIISIGCRLFQYKNQWLVVGLNRINDAVIQFKKYTVDPALVLNYIEDVTLERTLMNKMFLASPSISLIPPLKKMVTTWDAANSELLIPEDVVTHFPVNIQSNIEDRTAKYWQENFIKDISVLIYLGFLKSLGSGATIAEILIGVQFYYEDTSTLENIISGPYLQLNYDGPDTFVEDPVQITFADLASNYTSLENSFFIDGSDDKERFGSLELKFETILKFRAPTVSELTAHFDIKGTFTAITDNGSGKARIVSAAHALVSGNYIEIPVRNNTLPSYYNGVHLVQKIDNNTFDLDLDYFESFGGEWLIKPFKENFFFAVTRKDFKTQPDAEASFFISNFDDLNAVNGLFDFDIRQKDQVVSGVLKIDKIMFPEEGYYNVRLYPVVTHELLTSKVLFKKLDFTIKTDSDFKIERIRNVNYTTSHEVEVYHADSQMQLSDRSFLFSDAVHAAATAGTLFPLEIEITTRFYSNTAQFTNGALWYNFIVVGLSNSDYTKIKNGYQIFIKKAGTTDIVALLPLSFSVVDSLADGGKVLIQYNYAAIDSGAIYIAEDDTLYLKINTNSANTIDYADHWLCKWQRFGEAESIGFLEAVNAIYQGCLHEYNLKITGTYTAFLTPFDLVDFKYKGARRYTPVKMSLNLTEGTTNVTLVESKYTSLSLDTADVVSGDDVLDVNSEIKIVSTAIAPSMFVYNWAIQTNYIISGFSLVNAQITAQQLTAPISAGGVATGLQKTASISSASGMQVFNFPIITGDLSGWWQLDVVQNGVVSNTEFVEISPAVVLPSERIEIATVYINDVFNEGARYSINYIGFLPTNVLQSLQKFDINTQAAIGLPVVTSIDSTASTIDLSFSESGSYRLTVSENDKRSNEIGWLTIIL